MDIGIGDPIVGLIEFLTTPSLLKFTRIQPIVLPCYPITQQIAEKVHALTRFHPSGAGSRIKDLVDILIMTELNEIDGDLLICEGVSQPELLWKSERSMESNSLNLAIV